MNIETLEVAGFAPALKGMRNPMNSWEKIDSHYNNDGKYIIGKNDLDLAQRLIKAGAEHMKFMRMIQVWADMDMPRYFWSEMDTYKFNSKNSCSTMHRLLHPTTEITKELFLYSVEEEEVITSIIKQLNKIRKEYLESKLAKEKHNLIRRAKQLLPEGFLQLRTVNTNYAELRNVYFQRKNHKLKPEWQDAFCNWVESLPYAKELITLEK